MSLHVLKQQSGTNWSLTFLAILSIAAVVSTSTWLLAICQCHWAWDDANYLYRAIYHANQVGASDNLYWLRLPYSLLFEQTKPPLLTGIVAAALLSVDLPHITTAVSLTVSLIGIGLYAAVWHVSRERFGHVAATLAVIVVVASPATMVLTADLMVEALLSFWIIVSIHLACQWQNSPTIVRSLVLGAVCGLGLLTKLSFGLFVALPAAIVLTTYFRRCGFAFQSLSRPTLTCLGLLTVALPWYWRNLDTALDHGGAAATFHLALGSEAPTQVDKVLDAIASLPGWPMFILFLGSGLLMVLSKRRLHVDPGNHNALFVQVSLSAAVLPIVAMFATPFFIPRFLQPVWPLLTITCGLLTAIAWQQSRNLSRIGMLGILALGVWTSVSQLHARDEGRIPWELGDVIANATNDGSESPVCQRGDSAQWNVYKLRAIVESLGAPGRLPIRPLGDEPPGEDCAVLVTRISDNGFATTEWAILDIARVNKTTQVGVFSRDHSARASRK